MKVHKITLMVVDHDGLGECEIADVLECQTFPNRCISPAVMEIDSREIGDWSDDHPLNSLDTMDAEFDRLFDRTFKRAQ